MRDAVLTGLLASLLAGLLASLLAGLLASLHLWAKHKVWRYQMLLSYIPFVNWKRTEILEEARARRAQRHT